MRGSVVTLRATVEAATTTLGGNLPVPATSGASPSVFLGQSCETLLIYTADTAGHGGEKMSGSTHSGSGVEKRRKRGEGVFPRRRVEGEHGYFRGQRRRINGVIHVSLRNTYAARFCLSSSPRRPSFPEVWLPCKREPGIRVMHAGYLQ